MALLFLFGGFAIYITLSLIIEKIKEKREEIKNNKSKAIFYEKEYKNNTETINELKNENKKLKNEAENFKNMYYKIMEAKDIMSIIKILDENNSPEITKEKLTRLWDVLPYYPPDWEIRKWIVKQRDGYRCRKCNKDLYYSKEGVGEVHHIRPLSIGGTNEIKNLLFLCHECHKKVHDEMFNFEFSRCTKFTLYDDWTYYKIFRASGIDPTKRHLLQLSSYDYDEPDTDKYYDIAYWENKYFD